VNAAFPPDVIEFWGAARHRFDRLGGPEFALLAEQDRALRTQAAAALADLGADELDVRADEDQLLAGALLCRASGAVALPWPVVEDLLRVGERRLTLVDLGHPRVDHGDLAGEWIGADLDGTSHLLATGSPRPAKLGPFLVPATVGARQPDIPADDVARHLVLGVWRLLGGLEAALAEVVEHVGARTQFGKTLGEFQTVRFAIADATVSLRGLEELAKYTTWRLLSASDAERQVDAIALRLAGADAAVAVLRTCHQLLGAVGFCDEHDVSVFDRHLQPLIRLPESAERLAQRLVPAVRTGAFATLFS